MSNNKILIPVGTMDIENYINAVKAAGGEPVVVYDTDDPDIYTCDGLLIPGGDDINPARYGQGNCGSHGIDDELDALQFAALDAYVKAGKPVLGICRGCQMINVYFGGTLIQHLPQAARHARGADRLDKVHECTANKGSWLADLYGTSFYHNSSHHQAADELGRGIVADSYCTFDGTVESIHHETLPLYAVQWHPERMCLANSRTDTVDGILIFRFFMKVLTSRF